MDKNNTPKSKFKQKNCYTEKLRKATRKESNDCSSPRKSEPDGRSPGKRSPRKGGGGNVGHGSFPEYLAPVEVVRGLQNKTLIEGVLRINPKNYEDAFISSPEAKDQDIYIKGIVSRNRALNGDVVVVNLDSPDKWKVNHGVIQDFVEMKATEEDKRILMENCVVNIKKEEPRGESPSKFVNSNINIGSVAAHYNSAKIVDVVDIASSEEEDVKEEDADIAAMIQNSVDPLASVPEADASDYECEEVEEAEDKVDIEQEINARLKGLCLTKPIEIVEVDDSDSGDDVVVEGVDAVNTTFETAVDTTADMSIDSEASSPRKKRTRRGRRGKGGSTDGDTSVNMSMSSNNSSVRRQPPAKPLVEYNILSVLKFHSWPQLGFVQKTGKVVSIKEFKHSRLAAGYIRPMNDGNPNYFLFSPTDSRVPRMKIPSAQAPANFSTRPEIYDGVMFMAAIDKWDKVSMAMGKLIKSLGHSSDIGVRTEALLLENNIDFAEFPDVALADLPLGYDTWTVPDKEIQRRRDFRSECVFTIDPATARDLDDALSVTRLEEGLYRVGVHIADVSYFVRAGTALDKVALDRATSTYLVERVVPMLPRPLCEKLCSLNPHENRLTFSVEWTINDKAEILSEWFGRSVICSCAKLSYEDAQALIDHGTVTGVSVASPHTLDNVSDSVRIMNKLAVQLRSRREERGALRLDQPKLSFTLNSDTGLPDGFKLHEHRLSNKMIEEFMLLANMAVARKIFTTFPKVAILRRHPDPKMDMLDKIVEQLGFLGVQIDGLTSSALAQSIDRIKASGDIEKLACVTSLCSKPMELARYFCTGIYETHEYHHYALNVPLYTHFTSPIRRYPDILVHRLLDMAVRGQSAAWDSVEVEKAAQHCNDKRLAAKKVGEASAELFLAVFIAECGPLSQAGVVTGVMDHALDVLVLQMGVVKRVYVDRCGVTRHSFNRTAGVSQLTMIWEDGVKMTLRMMTKVMLTLSKGDRDFEFIAVIDKPEHEDEQDVITID